MSTQEEFHFDANVESLMATINDSVYQNKDCFIRELISNASDALDKLALEYTNHTDLLPHNEWYIEVKVDGNKIIISDTGIGMTKNDLINFLGCIAQSGTRKLKENKETKDKNMIGQFGIGFYSAYQVAKKVEVISKHPLDKGYKWESDGIFKYSITPVESELTHGTTVVLHIKEGNEEYLQVEKLTELIKKFSLFVQYPIYVVTPTKKEKKIQKEIDEKIGEDIKKEELNEEDKKEVLNEEKKEEETEEIKKEKEEETEEIKKEQEETEVNEKENEEMTESRVRVNKDKELWNKKIEEIPKEELTSFYKEISNDWDDFLECKSWKLEGVVNFNLLLFIPKRIPFNLFDKSFNKNRIKLYCANVYVTDELNCLPDYLTFVTGIVSTDDLPMSISRENVQGTSFHKMLKKMLVNKIIDMIDGIKEYDDFYKEYSTAIKLMARDDERFIKYLRYYTTKSLDKMKSLEEYTQSDEVKEICVITGLSKEECLDSFYLKKYKNKEVILMTEPADELLLQSLKKYKDILIKRVTVNDTKSEENEEVNELNNELTKLLNLEKVVINNSLDIPCLITTNEYGSSGTFEKIMQAQNANHPYFMFGMSKKILEVNYNHPLVKRIKSLYDTKDSLFAKLAKVMYNTALLSCGYKINEVKDYCEGIYDLLTQTNNIKISDINSEEKIDEESKIMEESKIETDEVL